MDYVNSLLDLIGNTPLLRLSTSLDDLQDSPDAPLVLAKICLLYTSDAADE